MKSFSTFFDFATSRFGHSFQRFLHNSAAQGFGQIVNIAAQIFSIPAFLHYWTKTEYGEWLVITSIPSLLWTLDNGLSGLAAIRMTMASGAGDWAAANIIFHNVLVIQGVLSLAILAFTGWFVAVQNVGAAFGFTQMTRIQSGEVLFIMIIYMLLGYSLGLLRAAYRACMMEARGVSIVNFQRLTDFAVLIVVLSNHGHAVALAEGMLGSMSFWAIFSYLEVRRRCPQITFAFGPVSRDQFTSMMVDGLPVMAGTAAGAFFLQGYPLIVNRLLGPVAVVTLTAVRTASRTLLQMVGMVSSASVSELSRTYGSRDWEGYLRLLKVLLAVTVWSSVAAAVGLTVFGPWVIKKWTLGKVEVDHGIMLLFALSIACQCGWSACGSILFSTNMHHAFNYAYLFLTMVGLAGAYFAMHFFGFAGVPLVMIVVDAILLSWALHLCHRKLTFVSLASLACVFLPSFYFQKARRLFLFLTQGGRSA
jgi:O-antigen/teichoic acid export membrane protein